jgi:hypothetical protein
MSALGQNQTSNWRPLMSALPPKADITAFSKSGYSACAGSPSRARERQGDDARVQRSDRNPARSDPSLNQAPAGAILRPMKVEEIAEVVAKLPPDQLARFRRWFTAFEAGRPDHAEELDSTATKLGRLAGRAFAELKKRAKEP